MDISYKWLRSLIEFDMDPEQLAERLTMSGHAVEEMSYLGRGLEDVVVGRVTAVRDHPDADRLRLAEVDYGDNRRTEVVCGAPNVEVGGVYPLALEGAKLASGIEVKKAKIRGVESRGMLCAEDELGLSDDHSGLLELDRGLEPGSPLTDAMGRDDWRLTLEITANRGDMWSHIGVARELQPFAGRDLELPDSRCDEQGQPIGELTSVEISDPEGCPRYMARVITDVKVGPSPRWLVERLESVGQRSISNVVDVTNYVMLELGQPLHSFDLDRLDENRIVVRKAAEGEKITTLDDVERTLTSQMTVIADASKPVAVAGVMGDARSEVHEGTTRILLECAYFDPVTNRRTARRLGMMTEASRRFERGNDYGLMPRAIDRAARLIAEVSGGKVVPGVIDEYPNRIGQRKVGLRRSRVGRVLGDDFSDDEIRQWLGGVGFELEDSGDGEFTVTVPTWRQLDVTREADLIEELARLRGYDRIPLPARLEITPRYEGRNRFHREMNLRRALAGMGFREIMTTSFVDSRFVEKIYGAGGLEPPRLESPIASDEDVLRPALLPGMLGCVGRNLNRRHRDLRLFEIGNVFTRPAREGGGAGEQKHLVMALTGSSRPLHWSGEAEAQDFFSLKGMLESLLERMKLPQPEFRRAARGWLHPGECAELVAGDTVLGCMGRLNPGLADRLELPEDVFLLEVEVGSLLSAAHEPVYRAASPYPGIRRDLSILVGLDTECADLIAEIRKGSDLVRDVTVFDLYQGEHVPEGKRSLAMSVHFQSRERTLRDEEADRVFKRIFNRLVKKFGVEPR